MSTRNYRNIEDGQRAGDRQTRRAEIYFEPRWFGRLKEGARARTAQRNKKAETEVQGETCRRRPGVTGTLVWRWRENEEEAWSRPSVFRRHRNVKASLTLLEDSLQKIWKFTFKFRVCICRKYQVTAPTFRAGIAGQALCPGLP